MYLFCYIQVLVRISWVIESNKKIFKQRMIRLYGYFFRLFIKYIFSIKYCVEIRDKNENFQLNGGEN